MLAAPMPGASDAVLTEALRAAVQRGLVDPSQHAVCLLACKDDLVLKVSLHRHLPVLRGNQVEGGTLWVQAENGRGIITKSGKE